MMVIGVTGSFGTGKTFVTAVFRSLGAKVIDADKIAHRVIRRGTPAYRGIIGIFGSAVLNNKREIDRAKLGKIVFNNKALLKRLAGIVHPQVVKYIKEEAARASRKGARAVVIDAPLLIEAHLTGLVNELVVVKCERKEQVKRCERKFCLKRQEVLKRIASQMPIAKKIQMADHVIDNSASRLETRKQVRKLWEEMSWR